jgi:glycosyltransferase involved in cell wall biosynthesis
MKTSISVCMIVKNEAPNLARCLQSVKDLADEIIIVDTGSEDQTVQIASKFTDKVFHFDWCDDFSAARNQSLKHATCDWILIIDADEALEPRSVQILPHLLNAHNNSVPLLLNARVLTPGKKGIFTKAFFPNHLGIHFKGRVHEWPAIKGQWLKGIHCPELVFHQHTPELEKQRNKLERYNQILVESIAETDNAYEKTIYLKHLGECYLELANAQAAHQAFLSAQQAYLLSQAPKNRLVYHQLLLPLIQLELEQGFKPLALCQELTEYFPDYTEGWLLLAYVHFLLGQIKACKEALLRVHIEKIPRQEQKRVQAQLFLLQGRVCLLEDNLDSGLNLLEKAWSVTPGPELAWHLCRAQYLNKDLHQANFWATQAQGQSLQWESHIHSLPLWSALEQAQFTRRNLVCTHA